jgi:hypothetical protein
VAPSPLTEVQDDPILGPAWRDLQRGKAPEHVVPPLIRELTDAPLDAAKRAYQTARQAMTALMLDPASTPASRSHLSDLLTAAGLALRERGVDPFQPLPSATVRFDQPAGS